MAKHPVSWWEIGAKDYQGLIEFYHKAFGWETKEFRKDDYCEIVSGNGKDGGIGGGIFNTGGKCPPYLTFYVEVDDVDAHLKLIADLGGDQVGEPFDIPDVGRMAMAKDPEGNVIGLIKCLPQNG